MKSAMAVVFSSVLMATLGLTGTAMAAEESPTGSWSVSESAQENETSAASVAKDQVSAASTLPPGVTITGGPSYTIELDCNAIPDGSTVYIGHQPGERLFTPGYNLCGQFLQVNRYVGELGGGGVALGFSGPSEIYPNSIFSSAKITIIYYRALRATGNGLDITPGSQTVNGTVGSPIVTKALAADDFTAVPTYTVSPPLPSGLGLDPDTGVISGTPSTGQATTTYTITGTNGSEVATSQVNLTVYAYSVLFQPGNGASVSPTSIGVVSDGDSITLPTPTRANYRFDGWFTASTGGTLVGQAGDAYVPTATIVLYAQWTAYRITINRQGGSGSPSSLTVMPGDSISLPSQSNQSRLNFAGWYDSSSGGTLLGQSGDNYTPAGNVTIYAQWNATLSYSLGGGSMPNGESSTKVVNVNTTPSITLPTPTRSGHEFTGWYSSSSGGSKLGDGGGSFTVTENDTLYARWAVVATVTFDPGDYGQVVDDQRCTTDPNDATRCQIEWRGSSLVLPDATSPTGLTFEGWWQNSSFSGSSLGVGGDTWSRTPYSATLYSRWSGTITFDAAGGAINTQSRTQRAGRTSFTEFPYRPGYAFEGWFDSDGSIALPRQNTSFTMTSTDTWTARWQQEPGAPEVVSAELVNDRKTIRVEFSGDVQAPYGDNFLCSSFSWVSTPKDNSFDVGFARQCSVNGSIVHIVPTGNPLSMSTTALTIAYKGVGAAAAGDPSILAVHSPSIAVIGAIPTSTVTFDVGFIGGTVPPPATGNVGSNVTLPSASREGYALVGWFTQPIGGQRAGRGGGSYKVPDADVILYARWVMTATPPRPVAPDPSTPPSAPTPEQGTIVDEDGTETTVVVRPIPRPDDTTVSIGVSVGRDADDTNGVPGFQIDLEGVNAEGDPVELSPEGLLILSEDRRVAAEGTGFVPEAPVAFYLLPSDQPIDVTSVGSSWMRARSIGIASMEPLLLGILTVDDTGDFTGTLVLPDGLSSGDYLVQAVGHVSNGELLTVTLGVRVEVAPEPEPATPAGPPLNLSATPSEGAVVLTWSPPERTGDFPITTYQVVGSPSGTCLVSAPAQTCVITGLTNGVEYTFRVRALTGAGWGSYSEPTSAVIPEVGDSASILVTGTRADVRGRPGVQVTGVTTGLEGALVTPRVRLAKEEVYSDGVGLRTVGQDGRFTWQRVANRWVYVYFVADGVRSNRLVFR